MQQRPIEVVGSCPVWAPLVDQKGNLHDEALCQQHLVRQSPHLGAASLRCNKVLEEGTHELERYTRTVTKHVMRQDCQLLSHSLIGLLGCSTTTARAIPLPSVRPCYKTGRTRPCSQTRTPRNQTTATNCHSNNLAFEHNPFVNPQMCERRLKVSATYAKSLILK